MTGLLFESIWLLAMLLATVTFVAIAWWARQRCQRSSRAAVGMLCFTPAMLLLSHFVVTPGERMVLVCRTMAQAMEDGDVQAIAAHLSDDLSADGMDRDEFLAAIERALTRYDVNRASLRSFSVDRPSDTRGVVLFTAMTSIRAAEGFVPQFPTRWEVTFRKHGNKWQVCDVSTVPIPPLHASDLGALMR